MSPGVCEPENIAVRRDKLEVSIGSGASCNSGYSEGTDITNKKARIASSPGREASGITSEPEHSAMSGESVQREVSGHSNASGMSANTYIYESDDDDYSEACPLETFSTENFDWQVDEVNSRFGDDRAIFCPAGADTVASRVHYLQGHLYLVFPIGVEMHNLSKVWGFNAKDPIMLRMNVPSAEIFGTSQLLSKQQLGIEFYQCNEPPMLQQRAFVAKPSATTESEERKPKERSSFRLGHQLKQIAENFVVANWEGVERVENILTLNSQPEKPAPVCREISMQQCPNCTFLNSKSGLEKCFMCGYSLTNVTAETTPRHCPHCTYINHDVDESMCGACGLSMEINTDESNNAKRCKVCTLLNPVSSIQCSMCGSKLQNSATHELPGKSYGSSGHKAELLGSFLDASRASGSGLLVRLYAYLNARIPQLHRFCVICDDPHVTNNLTRGLPPIRPCVCRRELCSWAFVEMGIGRESTDELASAAEVVDLLLAITTAAAKSTRSKLILNPFPLVMHQKTKILDPDQPDYDEVREMVDNLPSMQQLVAGENEADLKSICKRKGDHIYDLLVWVTSSCPAHLVSLQGPHRLVSMGTPYQFLVRSASHEQERYFSLAKKTHGSTFAFHGSRIENWHAILRLGLKNASGTALQMNGAAFGSGVYVSPSASMSLGYSGVYAHQFGTPQHASRPEEMVNGGGNNFISGQQVFILALCEIIDDGEMKKHGNVWVIPNEKNTITRFLFVFIPSSPGFQDAYSAATNCNTTNDVFQGEIGSFMEKVSHGDYA